eukprot:361168-Chlamydomonas_euryale.AAC.2
MLASPTVPRRPGPCGGAAGYGRRGVAGNAGGRAATLQARALCKPTHAASRRHPLLEEGAGVQRGEENEGGEDGNWDKGGEFEGRAALRDMPFTSSHQHPLLRGGAGLQGDRGDGRAESGMIQLWEKGTKLGGRGQTWVSQGCDAHTLQASEPVALPVGTFRLRPFGVLEKKLLGTFSNRGLGVPARLRFSLAFLVGSLNFVAAGRCPACGLSHGVEKARCGQQERVSQGVGPSSATTSPPRLPASEHVGRCRNTAGHAAVLWSYPRPAAGQLRLSGVSEPSLLTNESGRLDFHTLVPGKNVPRAGFGPGPAA